MPRSQNYYDQEPVVQFPTTPKQQKEDLQQRQAQEKPQQPLVSQGDKIRDAQKPQVHRVGDVEFRVNDPSYTQVQRNMERAKEKAFDENLLRQKNRSFASRVPYNLSKVLMHSPGGASDRFTVGEFQFPTEQEWENLSFYERSKVSQGGLQALAKRTVWALPKAVLGAIPKLGLSVAQLAEESVQARTGTQDRENIVPQRMNVPLLGELPGFRGTYEDNKALGMSPMMAAIGTTGEVAGDLAISASLAEAMKSAFKPTVKTLGDKVVRSDPRALKGVQVKDARTGKPTAVESKASIFETAPNSTVEYFPISNSAAAKFKGTRGNTFVKVTPIGQGKAQFSVVQIRKGMANRSADWLRNKFGRGNVVQGKNGPELKLESSVVKYDPNVAIAGGDLTSMTRMSKVDKMLARDPRYVASRGQAPAALTGKSPVASAVQGQPPAVPGQAPAVSAGQDPFVGNEFSPATSVSSREVGTKNFDLFRGDVGGKVENVNKDFQNVIEIQGDQITLLKELSKNGDEQAAELLKGPLKYNEYDKFLDPYLVSKGYDAVTYKKPGFKDAGQEVRAVGTGESFATNKGLAELYSLGKAPKRVSQLEGIQKTKKLATDITKSTMSRPIKGTGDLVTTPNQVQQIANLADDRGLDDTMIQTVSSAMNGKQNIAELTQDEAFEVSESIRMFNQTDEFVYGDSDMIVRPYTHPARYWMEAAERELGHKVYSQVYLPMENAMRVNKVFKDSWQNEAREIYGKYSDPKFSEERRAITQYLEGNKDVITKNKAFSKDTSKDLVEIADWLKEQYKGFFKELGITSDRFFEVYSPQIRERGGIFNLYKTDEVPNEIRPFFEFEREGSFAPREEDSLALFDIYSGMAGKERFLRDSVENSKKVIERLPENLRASTNDYLQEKLGYQDKVSQVLNKMGQNISHKLGKNVNIPENVFRQIVDYGMSTSYAGALGLPRIMPLVRNLTQTFLTTYPELGPEWFAKGAKAFAKEGSKELKEKGFLVESGVPYGGDLVSISKRTPFGKGLDKYKRFNEKMMKPYAQTDTVNRSITYLGVRERFNNFYDQYKAGKIEFDEFEQGIDLESFNPTLRNILRKQFASRKPKDIEDGFNIMVQDIIDRTQFPYRKGTQSRAHYGLKGKLGLQFSQWTWEYAFTLKSWAARGQWNKLIRWYAASSATKRTFEDLAGVDASKWVGAGPISGLPMGPLTNAAWSTIQMINGAAQGMSEDVNENWKEIAQTLKIYGGTLSGVGKQRIQKVLKSVKRHEAGISSSPDPEKPFGMFSNTGKLLRWVDFNELFKFALGFPTQNEEQFRDKLGRVKKDEVQYKNKVNDAMNMLVDGDMDKFEKFIEKNEVYMGDVSAKLRSYNVDLTQRIFQNLPIQLKQKYFNVFYPTDSGISAPK